MKEDVKWWKRMLFQISGCVNRTSHNPYTALAAEKSSLQKKKKKLKTPYSSKYDIYMVLLKYHRLKIEDCLLVGHRPYPKKGGVNFEKPSSNLVPSLVRDFSLIRREERIP